jgi:hypothetical protein
MVMGDGTELLTLRGLYAHPWCYRESVGAKHLVLIIRVSTMKIRFYAFIFRYCPWPSSFPTDLLKLSNISRRSTSYYGRVAAVLCTMRWARVALM